MLGPPPPEGGAGDLHSLLQSLSRTAHVLPLRGDDIEVLESPDDFFQELLAGLRTAQRRVIIASLYLGTGGGREAEFAAALAAAAHDGERPRLRINLLLDALRCTRPTRGQGSSSSSGGGDGSGGMSSSSGGGAAAPQPPMTSTAEMLATRLLEGQAEEGRVAVSLFHTPALRGLLKRVLPLRVAEVVGVMHMKAFVFDDTVVLSGANISTTYLSSRQDRYWVLRGAPQLAGFLHSVVAAVGRFSYQLLPASAAAAASTRRGDALLQLLARQQQLLLGSSAGAGPPRRHHLQRHRLQRSQRYALAPCPAGVDPVGQAPLFCSALRQHLLQLFAPPDAWHSVLDFAALEAEAAHGALQAAAGAAAAGAQDASQASQQPAQPAAQHTPGQAVAVPAHSSAAAGGASAADSLAAGQPDTWIVPLVQAGFAGVRQDERCTLGVLSWATQQQQQRQGGSGGAGWAGGGAWAGGAAPPGGGAGAAPPAPCALLQLASPYLNLARPYEWFLARQAGAAELELVTASPEANGFWGSQGLSGHIPLAYSLLEHRTWRRLTRRRGWLPHAREARGGGARALAALAARRQLWRARGWLGGGGAGGLSDAAAAGSAAAAAGSQPAAVAAAAAAAEAAAAGGGAALAAARRLYEYQRPGWEFHSKGLWVSLPQHGQAVRQQQGQGQGQGQDQQQLQAQQAGVAQQQRQPQGEAAGAPRWAAPAVSLVGSSNFGWRSLHRDLEVQFVLVTRNERLRQALGGEVVSLKRHCQAVEGEAHFLAPGRRGGALARLAVRLLRGFL